MISLDHNQLYADTGINNILIQSQSFRTGLKCKYHILLLRICHTDLCNKTFNQIDFNLLKRATFTGIFYCTQNAT